MACLLHRCGTGSLDTTAREFVGFTDRVCKWAWKLSEFFDLNVSRECYVRILNANLVAYEERKKEEHQEGNWWLEKTATSALGREQRAAWQRHKTGDEILFCKQKTAYEH